MLPGYKEQTFMDITEDGTKDRLMQLIQIENDNSNEKIAQLEEIIKLIDPSDLFDIIVSCLNSGQFTYCEFVMLSYKVSYLIENFPDDTYSILIKYFDIDTTNQYFEFFAEMLLQNDYFLKEFSETYDIVEILSRITPNITSTSLIKILEPHQISQIILNQSQNYEMSYLFIEIINSNKAYIEWNWQFLANNLLIQVENNPYFQYKNLFLLISQVIELAEEIFNSKNNCTQLFSILFQNFEYVNRKNRFYIIKIISYSNISDEMFREFIQILMDSEDIIESEFLELIKLLKEHVNCNTIYNYEEDQKDFLVKLLEDFEYIADSEDIDEAMNEYLTDLYDILNE